MTLEANRQSLSKTDCTLIRQPDLSFHCIIRVLHYFRSEFPLAFHSSGFSMSSTTPARQTTAPSIAQSYQSNLMHTDNSSYTSTSGLSLSHAKFNQTCGFCVLWTDNHLFGFHQFQKVRLVGWIKKHVFFLLFMCFKTSILPGSKS